MIRRRLADGLNCSGGIVGQAALPRQLVLERDAPLADDVETGLQARAVVLEERRRVLLALVGLLRPTSIRSARRVAGRAPAARPRRGASAGRSRRRPSRRTRRSRPGRRSGARGGAGRRPRGAERRRGGPRRRRSRRPVSLERRAFGIAVSSTATNPASSWRRRAVAASGSAARGVGLELEHELVVRHRRGQRQGVVLIVLILRLLELLRQQFVARRFVEIGVSGPGFARRDVAHNSATLRGRLALHRTGP